MNSKTQAFSGQYEDFGEKIGGAKKDLWRKRGLYAEDLEAMNEREADKFVKKDNIWKKQDYQAMLDEGTPLGVVYYIKKARDALPVSPQYQRGDSTPEKRLVRQKEYIETVRELQRAVSEVRTVEDAMKVHDRFFVENGYLEPFQSWDIGPHYRATEKGRKNPAITDKLSSALFVRSEGQFDRIFTQKAQQEQFGVSKEQKVPRGYGIYLHDGTHTYYRSNEWKPNTYYVTKGYTVLQTNFETREEALKWAQGLAKSRRKSGKARVVPPQLADVRRTGPDYRGGVEITGQHYLDTFGFRGGEFGNWMNRNDRQTSLNMGFEALKDLAAALQISDKDIACQGTLAIAFGDRGSGNAAAHYEPLRKVINLTKMQGAGSLAHEWWHGLDDYLGAKLGAKGMLSEQPGLYAPFQKLVNTIKYKQVTPEQGAALARAHRERVQGNAAQWLDDAVSGALYRYGSEEQAAAYAVLKAAFLSGKAGSVEQISALNKAVTGSVIPKNKREQLELCERILSQMQEQEEPEAMQIETDFYWNSVRMGKECERDGGYWDSNTEMTARAFACYIKDKLPGLSDYLVGHAECAVILVESRDKGMTVLKAFPEGEERNAINAVFDEIVAELKRDRLLTHCGTTELFHEQAGQEQLSKFSRERPSVVERVTAIKRAGEARPPLTAPEKDREPER